MDEIFAQLEAQYCPPIDPALLSAIVSDYNLADQKELENAQNTLDSLKECALVEEALGFDASGTGGLDGDGVNGKRPESQPDTSVSQSKETDFTSVSNGLSSLSLEDESESRDVQAAEAEELENLNYDMKMQLLQEMFGKRISRYSIEHTLQKCNERWNTAMEELLNHVYFGDTESAQDGNSINSKGVEAFSEENVVRRERKGKSKNKRSKNVDDRRSSSLPGLRDQNPAQSTNKWKSSAEDIEFIASRTGIKTARVRSIYYEQGASSAKTISALLTASMEDSKYAVVDGATVSNQALELGRDFPNIAPEYLTALIRLTHPSTAAAHELASALTYRPKDSNGGIQIIPRYTRPDDVELESSWSPVTKKPKSAAPSRKASSEGLSSASRRDAYDLARAAAFSQAHAARRKAKSDHLMSGAAAYYSQVGREYASLSSTASAQAADELAASQSSTTQLDLHGIDVVNAVRIAQQKVEAWWEALGESRVNGRLGAEDRQAGYRIVVGLGRHSEGGKGKLGPAVTKMLRREGWSVEAAGAIVIVRGPAKT